MHTQAVEDYLKTIYEIQSIREKVTTTILAERMNVAPASVTGMVKKLAEMNLVEYKPYQGVTLTQKGQKIALEVLRHHRLIERYLSEALGVPWDLVHDEAEKWEHVLSEDLEKRIDAVLGYPTTDPHGSPIPNRQGIIEERDCILLTELKPGDYAVVTEVSDHNAEMLRYLGKLNLYPETEIYLETVAPFDGPLTLTVEGDSVVLGREVARNISVTKINDA